VKKNGNDFVAARNAYASADEVFREKFVRNATQRYVTRSDSADEFKIRFSTNARAVVVRVIRFRRRQNDCKSRFGSVTTRVSANSSTVSGVEFTTDVWRSLLLGAMIYRSKFAGARASSNRGANCTSFITDIGHVPDTITIT